MGATAMSKAISGRFRTELEVMPDMTNLPSLNRDATFDDSMLDVSRVEGIYGIKFHGRPFRVFAWDIVPTIPRCVKGRHQIPTGPYKFALMT